MDFNANPRVITAKIPSRSHGLAVWNGVFALTVHALEGARTVTKIFELGERESEMEFVDKTRGYHMDDSYEYNPAAESRPGTQSKKKRRSRAGLFVLVFLILMAVGLFVLYSDMKRDLRHGVYRCEDQRMMELPIEPDQEKISVAADSIWIMTPSRRRESDVTTVNMARFSFASPMREMKAIMAGNSKLIITCR